MWRLQPPVDQSAPTFALCISRVRDNALRFRLTGSSAAVEASNIDYFQRSAQFHTVAQANAVGLVGVAEMVSVYDDRMARKGSPGRAVYDRLKLVAQDRCPFCDQRDVSTLDHFLPKTLYPGLAVNPANLVPACMECNKVKGDVPPTSAADTVFHPYFDNFGDAVWLTGTVVQTAPAAVVFSVSPPQAWSPLEAARASHHFDVFGLSRLYSSHAARELSQIRRNLAGHFASGGAQEVRDELLKQWASRSAVGANSWQAALYASLSSDDWFCAGGFA